jgi:hypothetical protein
VSGRDSAPVHGVWIRRSSPEVSHHQRLGCRIELTGLERMAFQPVEPIRAQQDEVNDQRKYEQKREEPDEGAPRIKE